MCSQSRPAAYNNDPRPAFMFSCHRRRPVHLVTSLYVILAASEKLLPFECSKNPLCTLTLKL